jgi:catechol 2,3-dioxygenase-like lactoylglutathione lyase family enzyme
MRFRWSAPAVLALGMTAAAQPANPFALDGIAHVAFRVSDVPRARAFYRRLGFEQAFEFDDANGISVSYVKVNDRQFIELYRRQKADQPLGLMHVCFEGSDLPRLAGAYRSRGLNVRDPRTARAGNLLFSLHDPEGQLIEYTQYMPGSLHSNTHGKYLGTDRIGERLVAAARGVNNVAAERAFFEQKLGFKLVGGGKGEARLETPGAAGEEMDLIAGGPRQEARIVFAVDHPKAAAKQLRRRGIRATRRHGAAVIHDPDGTTIVFAAWRP